MMKYLKGKTWIDWVKIIVAIDIAQVGIGLIFQREFHILPNIAGPVSRIIFGALYVVVAVAIFKMVFPALFEDLKGKAEKVGDDLHDSFDSLGQEPEASILEEDEEPKETVGELINKAAQKIDGFVQDRSKEVKEEIKKTVGKDE